MKAIFILVAILFLAPSLHAQADDCPPHRSAFEQEAEVFVAEAQREFAHARVSNAEGDVLGPQARLVRDLAARARVSRRELTHALDNLRRTVGTLADTGARVRLGLRLSALARRAGGK